MTRAQIPPLGNEHRLWLAAGTGTLLGRQQGLQSYNYEEVNPTHSSQLGRGLRASAGNHSPGRHLASPWVRP